jgi:hypothetical protein
VITPYDEIDRDVEQWVAAHGFKLIREFGGLPRRFFYVSAGKESFQISIEPPENGRALINLWSVETVDGIDTHEAWDVPIAEMQITLDEALRTIRKREFEAG